MKGIKNITYGLVVISLLLGSVLAPLPLAVAQENDDDDDREKIKDLKDKIKNILEKIKCKNHKYKQICDKQDPDLDITAPVKKDRLSAGLVTITGTASDEDSGIKNIKVRINNGPYQQVPLTSSGNWKLDTNLPVGKYVVTVKATDFAKNTESEHVQFRVISA